MTKQIAGTRSLKVLDAAGRHLNFTRAAAELKLTPDVLVDISCQLRDLERDEADVAIRFGRGNYPRVRSDRLFEHSIFPVCSPNLLRSAPPLRSPADILHHTLIHVTWSGQGVTWPDWTTWMQAAGVERFELKPGLHFEDSAFAIQAAINGTGIALGDMSLVADDLAAGRLVQPFALAINGPPMFAYFLVTPLEPATNSLVPSFREWVLREAEATKSNDLEPRVDVPRRPRVVAI
jgi:LysR family glycine cleavage system transcriptional activator